MLTPNVPNSTAILQNEVCLQTKVFTDEQTFKDIHKSLSAGVKYRCSYPCVSANRESYYANFNTVYIERSTAGLQSTHKTLEHMRQN